MRLNQISSRHFPIPLHDHSKPDDKSSAILEYQKTASKEKETKGVHIANRGTKIQITPEFFVSHDNVPENLDVKKAQEETSQAVLHKARKAQDAIESDQKSGKTDEENAGLPRTDAEIVFLGTGSAMPSKYRSVSGILLRVPGRGSYIFDCGENTLGDNSSVFSRPRSFPKYFMTSRGSGSVISTQTTIWAPSQSYELGTRICSQPVSTNLAPDHPHPLAHLLVHIRPYHTSRTQAPRDTQGFRNYQRRSYKHFCGPSASSL